MTNQFYRITGLSLIIGAVLIILTMVLHPSGGSIEHILEISRVITISHSLAIFSLPFVLFGFYGLSQLLLEDRRFSILALIIMAFGLFAAMLAAVVNGLTLPMYLGVYADSVAANRESLRFVTTYGFALNQPLDYVFIGGYCLSTLIYSALIMKLRRIPVWLGIVGATFVILVFLGVISGFAFTHLLGFRVFTFSLAAWVLVVGYYLIKSKSDQYA